MSEASIGLCCRLPRTLDRMPIHCRHGAGRVNDTPAERGAESTWTQAAPPQGRAVGTRIRRGRLGVPAGPRVRQRAPSTGRSRSGSRHSRARSSACRSCSSLPGTTATAASSASATPEFAILTLLLLLGGGAFWYYQRASETATVATPPSPTAVATATDRSIAVLPFVNMSADKEQEYFADGISEELLNLLAQVPELRVIARTSSFSFKGKDVDIAEIARRLNVANVLEGSVRKSGDTLRITAQLVRATDSSHLWSQTYDRPMTDVFAVQDEIAAAVVEELKIKLLGATPKAKTTDPRAYALFLKAREISRQFTAGALEQSIALYKESLAIDPLYAPAWDGLASPTKARWTPICGSRTRVSGSRSKRPRRRWR